MSSLIPEEELRQQKSLNLAPMVSFLFLILAIFAVIAVTRSMLYDTDGQELPSLACADDATTVLISIDDEGQYKWITEFNEFLLSGAEEITRELRHQQDLGLLPQENEKIKVLLQIDRHAQWHNVANAIFSIKEAGFSISPVYTQ